MHRKFVFGVALLAACGGGSPDATTAASARGTASPPIATSATATAATDVVTPIASTFAAVPAVPPPSARSVAELVDPAVRQKWFGGPKVPRSTREKTLKDFVVKWKELSTQPRTDRARNAVAFLKARPEIDDAGATKTNVWGRFKDGKLVIVPLYDWTLRGQRHAYDARPSRGQNAKEMPESKSETTMDIFSFTADTSGQIGGWMRKHGYEGAAVSAPSVKSLRNIKDAGVFFITTHGGAGYERVDNATANTSFNELYALMTSDAVKDSAGNTISNALSPNAARFNVTWRAMNEDASAKSADYESDLDSGKLVYFLGALDEAVEWHYGITRYFVDAYMTFSKNAFIYINACSSFSYEEHAPDLWSLFQSKYHPAVYLGWSDEASPPAAEKAAAFLMGRLLGEQPEGFDIPQDKPRQRPWDFSYAFGDLKSKGWHLSMLDPTADASATKGQPTTAELKYYASDPHVMLVPAIAKMEVDELKQELTIHGDLGDDPASKDRRVSVGGVDCAVSEWTTDKVTCKIPDTAAGDVIAERLGRKSNAAPLTTWKIKVRHKTELQVPGAMTNYIEFLGDVRVDMHPTRDAPQDQPKPRDPIPFYVARDSTCKGAGGTGKIVSGGGTATYAAGQEIPVMFQRPSGDSWCTMYGQIDPANKKIRMAIFAVTAKGAGSIAAVDRGVGFGHTFGGAVVPVPGLFDGSVSPPPGMNAPAMPTALEFPLDDKGVIAAGKRGPVDFANGHAKISIEYDAVTPTGYPTDDTPQ